LPVPGTWAARESTDQMMVDVADAPIVDHIFELLKAQGRPDASMAKKDATPPEFGWIAPENCSCIERPKASSLHC